MPSERSDSAPGPYLGALLRTAWERAVQQITADLVDSGFDDLGPAHLRVFWYPGPDGARPSDLASRMSITKQSVNDLVGHLEAAGYLVREPDPDDGRARVLRLTAKGRRLQSVVDETARRFEERVSAALGARRTEQLRASLKQVIDEFGVD